MVVKKVSKVAKTLNKEPVINSLKIKKPTNFVFKTTKKRYRFTFFQFKLVVGVTLILLGYRYDLPVDSFRDQEIFTLVVVGFLILSKPSPFYQIMKKFSYPKWMFVLVYLTFFVPVMGFANTKYLDWDNAQMIKGLARDFPALVEQVEEATGLDLEVSSNCMNTTEKFGNGVKTCEISAVYEKSLAPDMSKAIVVMESSRNFSKSNEYQNKEGYHYSFRTISSCEFRYKVNIYMSCITGVRSSNTQLAIEQFGKIK